jgi:YegS/Rv2252/BmrU family lipid kinase
VAEAGLLASGLTALVINARARLGGRAESAVVNALRQQGIGLDRVVRVPNPRRLGQVVDALLGQGVGRLIVGGGDGTLSTVAARLTRSEVTLGIIPLGTANDFARTLGIPARLADAATVAAGSHVREIDLAMANDQCFLNVASIGMSVTMTRLLSHRLKRWLGPAAYAVSGALAFARHPTFEARIETPAGSTVGRVHQVVVGNGRFYGGGVLVAHQSTLDDGTLAIYTLGRRSRWNLLRTVALLRFRVPIDRPGDIFLQTTTAHVVTEPPGKRVNLDGEIRTATPVTFTVVPKSLRVLTPS